MRFLSCATLHLQFHLAGHGKWRRTYSWNMCSCWGCWSWTAAQQLQLKESQISKNISVTLCKTPPKLPASKNTTRKGGADSLHAPGLAKLGEKQGFPCLNSKKRDPNWGITHSCLPLLPHTLLQRVSLTLGVHHPTKAAFHCILSIHHKKHWQPSMGIPVLFQTRSTAGARALSGY